MSKYRIKRFKQTITIADAGTTANGAVEQLNGILKGIIADIPALTSSHTLTVTIKDADGYTLFSKASIASGAVASLFVDANNQPYQIPLSGNTTITVTSSAAETGAKAIKVVLLLDRG